MVDGWYTGPATVTLTATDDAGGSGVAAPSTSSTAHRPGRAYTGPVRSPATARTRCGSGRPTRPATWRRPRRSTVKIDATAPVTTATFAAADDGGWHAGTVPVTLTATDAGVRRGRRWSGRSTAAPWTPYTAPVDVTGDGQHELLYRATDVAGNVETLKSAMMQIDGDQADGAGLRPRRRPALRRQPGRPGVVAGGRPDLGHRVGRRHAGRPARTPATRCRPCTSSRSACTS